MRKLIYLISVVLLLAGCGQAVPVIPSDELKTGDIVIHTVFYNTPAEVASVIGGREYGVIDSAFSTMVATDPIRLPDISQNDTLIVNTTFINNTSGRLTDITFGLDIEDISFVAREEWDCWRCFTSDDGLSISCFGQWNVQGGYIYNTITPDLPICGGDPVDDMQTCNQYVPEIFDCGVPAFYEIEYIEPNSGWKKHDGYGLDLYPGESFTLKAVTQNMIDIRDDHLIRIYAQSIIGSMIKTEYYIFNVRP